MLLSEQDITRLVKRGFSKKYFVHLDKQGYAVLKNTDGYCVFYDRTARRCKVYGGRPSGCRVYPVIVDEDEGVILDDICPQIGTISSEEKTVKGKRVTKLLERIDCEAANRMMDKQG
jgi:Fe-S-cluster containining protein